MYSKEEAMNATHVVVGYTFTGRDEGPSDDNMGLIHSRG